ncbi:HD domain-containing protein [Dyadobacter sp. NIV53]|uniref:HD domain-containing protein n=1 Tax=Dyadobacter sp. NIV53 TaxID=2861765 RepID=UPI001C868FB0|nr:HD domain-containing protein [Dyadobacter sp. NIV53]
MKENLANVDAAEAYIVGELNRKLPGNLYYHGLHHSVDVTSAALKLAQQERIVDPESLTLLKTAALYHDSGFMDTYKNHEEAGCDIVKNKLPGFGYTSEQIVAICNLIMATKLPQNPQTHLEKILCDADLDYLGRDDYEPIANTLFTELSARNLISDADSWNDMQVKFLGSHLYWTESARKNRDDLKHKHLRNLMSV